MSIFNKIFKSYSEKEVKRIMPIVDKINSLEDEISKLTDEELKNKTNEFKEQLDNGKTLDDILPEAFAVVREASKRVLGMRHFDVQLIGGIILHQGRIAEMKTGEGKTLVATLPVYLNALTGRGVHVITVNDYLAKRDSEWMGKLYKFMGLSVGLVIAGMDPKAKQKAYACDITYGTNNEFGFDYLRDNMVIYKEQLVQRDLAYAIVDEIDSILIDEARTPLIISGRANQSSDLYKKANDFVKRLTPKVIVEEDVKDEAQAEDNENYDYIVDLKAKSASLTQKGIKKAEEAFHLENFNDIENSTLVHHVNQALRAHGVMKKDIDYIVKDGEVLIVDEFTGRIMYGRRYNNGLHQAIEAKEGVKIADESKTLATITFQNYFRMYDKLSGMTGTAMTEEAEFEEIYNLDVISIPTNKPMIRKDLNDAIYKNEKAKFNAIVQSVKESHEKGQPVLIGTVSIEKSEKLSNILKKEGIKHEVLNAKYHEKEAEIIAQAGKFGAVTIATNMAGRGTDIMLGGNAEFLAKAEMRKREYEEDIINEAVGFADTDDEEILAARAVYKELYDKFNAEVKEKAKDVKAAGGLYILGTERHESRRIDNQLRGRSGRQGDEGESRFFLSVEDDLMRIFAGDRLENMMNTLNVEENMPIESKMLTRIIESSQKKVEGRNFSIRKNVLNYDDVLNKQREIIYNQRSQVLDGEDLHDYILNMMHDLAVDSVNNYLVDDVEKENWNIIGLKDHFMGWVLNDEDLDYDENQIDDVTKNSIVELLEDRMKTIYARKEEEFGGQLIRELERVILLKVVDTKWMNHIDDMAELKKGIGLRAFGQKNPVVEYRYEGFEMFDAMVESIREDTIRMLLTVRIQKNAPIQREQVAKPDAPNAGSIRMTKKKPADNDPCPCGSGKKYKKCCGMKEQQ